MTIRQKLQIIQNLSGLTQTQLAQKLGVSFVAFNHWYNQKSHPRKNALINIDALYRELTGEKSIPKTQLKAQKQLLFAKSKKYPKIIKKIIGDKPTFDQFLLALTYNSNRIEGSTLTERETALVLFNNLPLQNRTLIEQMEAKNHQAAVEYLFNYLSDGGKINLKLLLKLHSIVLNGISQEVDSFRCSNVRILGANLQIANYPKIPQLTRELFRDIARKKKDVVAQSAATHAKFEQIHPFVDGNGRVGRLLLTAMLLRANLPPAVIKQAKKIQYLQYLNTAQTKDDFSALEGFIIDAVQEGYRVLE